MKPSSILMALLLLSPPQILVAQSVNGSKPASVDSSKNPKPSAKSAEKTALESVPNAKPTPRMDPALSRFLLEEPLLRIQESIVYIDAYATSWVICPFHTAEAIRVRWRSAPVRMIPPPPSGLGTSFDTSYGQGALWCVVASDAMRALLLFRFDLDMPVDGWVQVGSFESEGHGDGGLPSLVVPLKKENRFLGISYQGLLEAGTERASFVGVFHNKDGKLHLESCVELPFDDIPNITKGQWFNIPTSENGTISAPEGKGRTNRFWMGHADPLILTPTLKQPSLSEDFLVLGAASAGVLWFLDLDNGRVRRTINLTGLNRRDLSKLSPLEHVILGTGFLPNGSLIVASKPTDLIKFTVALDLDKPDLPEKEMRKKDFESLRNDIKDICWWRIDPKNGSQERLDSPVDFPEQMPTAARQTVFRFLVNPFGYVKTNAFTPWSKVMEEFLTSFPDRSEGSVTTKDGLKEPAPTQ